MLTAVLTMAACDSPGAGSVPVAQVGDWILAQERLTDLLELTQPLPLQEGVGAGALELSHNLPAALRFSSNGLLLDGGTVVLAVAGTPLQRCVVMALPLGITRVGHWREGSCAPA